MFRILIFKEKGFVTLKSIDDLEEELADTEDFELNIKNIVV